LLLKWRSSKILVLLTLVVFLFSGCAKSPKADTNWQFQKSIPSPVKAICGSTEVTLGSIDTYGVELIIPANTFPTPTEVTLVNPDKVPKYFSKQMTGFGAPIQISVAGKESVRLQQPVTVRMKYDPAALGADLENGALYMSYYNGTQWQYIKTTVDPEKKVMTFATSHFSLFGQAKLTVDQRVEQYTKNAALAAWAQDQTNSITDEALNRAIDSILKDKLKINDEALKGQIINSIIKDDEWGGMLESIKNKDAGNFNQNLQVLIGKKIVDNVPASRLSSALGALTDDFGVSTVQKASEAAGYLAEGRTADAARIIGEHIADQFMITSVGKIAVAAIDNQIQSWKSEEIEAAYQAYKNGASSKVPWWGYQVEKGNFDDVWSQMGGAARQLEIDAIKAQENIRRDAGMPALTEAEKERLREKVRQDLQKQFESRTKTDAEIEKKQAELKMIMDMYKSSGFMDKGSWGWDKGLELEQRLDILAHFKDKFLKDTGRDFYKSGMGHNEDGISIDELKMASMIWFGTSNPAERQQKYAEYLKNEFGIILAPKVELLNGQWSSNTITITDYDLGPAPPPSEKPAKSEGDLSGCDLTDLDFYNMLKQGLEESKGKPQNLAMTLQLNAQGQGTMVITSEDGDKSNLPATYKDGALTATMSDQGATLTFNGFASEYGGAVTITGTFQINFGQAWIKGTWSAKK